MKYQRTVKGMPDGSEKIIDITRNGKEEIFLGEDIISSMSVGPKLIVMETRGGDAYSVPKNTENQQMFLHLTDGVGYLRQHAPPV